MKKLSSHLKRIIPAALLICFLIGCQQQSAPEITEESLQTTLKLVLELWNEGNFNAADQLYTTDVVRHDYGAMKDFEGLEAQKILVKENRTAFPDLTMTIDETFFQGNWVALRWTFTGTNTGPIGDMPPSGNQVQFSGASIVRLEGGKVAEGWDYYNNYTLLQQLGVIPPQGEVEE